MITAFMLVDTKKIQNFLKSLVSSEHKDSFNQFLAKIETGLSGVVRGQLTICFINATLTLIGLLVLKVKFSFLLATLAGIFSLVPIFGSIISTIPIVIVGMTQSFATGLFALLWIAGIHLIEANFLNPKILGNTAKIHPVIIILALVTGKHFWGIGGAILAVPIASIFLTAFNSLLIKAKQLEKMPN